MTDYRTAVIIPAYNEALRIGAVIEPALATRSIQDVIVVDDGSIDGTREAAAGYDITLVGHPINRGKGESLHSGVQVAREIGATTLVFLDADLHGLRPEHIDALADPVRTQEAIMTIGILERSLLQKSILKRWGGLSGQRALTINLWEQLRPHERHGFGVEAALNASTRHHSQHHRIKRVELRHVTHTGKREKEPTLPKAGLAYLRTYGAALGAYVRAEIVK